MAKLTRVLQKLFGSTAGVGQIGVFGSFAEGSPAFTTNPLTIQSLSPFLDGWYSAVLGENSPPIQDMNALDFLYSYQLAYLMQAGVAEWDATTTYYIGSFASSGTGDIFYSLIDNNMNNALISSSWRILGGQIRSVSANTTATLVDNLILVDTTAGNTTITLPAVASVPTGKRFTIKIVTGTNQLIILPTGGEVIEGAGSYVLYGTSQAATVENNGVSWNVVSYVSRTSTFNQVRLATGNGNGSTNVPIRRFATQIASTGNAILYADSVTLGATFTIQEPGTYSINYSDSNSGSDAMGVSLNSNQLTTSIQSITTSNVLTIAGLSPTLTSCASWTGRLIAGDVVRPHNSVGGLNGTGTNDTLFNIVKLFT